MTDIAAEYNGSPAHRAMISQSLISPPAGFLICVMTMMNRRQFTQTLAATSLYGSLRAQTPSPA
ncbi:MAG TPA: hypothetical protein VG345_08430, partial [Bryobacteraceae bacterium]|nr:hypothetical protein [Bryobacteraceae bacterium]